MCVIGHHSCNVRHQFVLVRSDWLCVVGVAFVSFGGAGRTEVLGFVGVSLGFEKFANCFWCGQNPKHTPTKPKTSVQFPETERHSNRRDTPNMTQVLSRTNPFEAHSNSIFNQMTTLPPAADHLETVKVEALKRLGTVIKRHELQGVVGIHILHLHFPLPDGHVFAEEPFVLRERATLLRMIPEDRISENALPCVFKSSGQAGDFKWFPVEYTNKTVVLQQDFFAVARKPLFLQEYAKVLSDMGLSNVLGEWVRVNESAEPGSGIAFLNRYDLSDTEVMTERNLRHLYDRNFDHLGASGESDRTNNKAVQLTDSHRVISLRCQTARPGQLRGQGDSDRSARTGWCVRCL